MICLPYKFLADCHSHSNCSFDGEAPMAAMCARAEALADGDERRACEARGQLEEFGRIHVAKWFLRFFERCEQESRHALYNAVGTLGTALLDVDGRQR